MSHLILLSSSHFQTAFELNTDTREMDRVVRISLKVNKAITKFKSTKKKTSEEEFEIDPDFAV